MRVLILLAHPALEKSRVNRRLLAAARAVDGVTVHDLYESYPDLSIDVEREQTLLGQYDVIVFQHPFFWYSTPALLKEWQDLVLEHGWAYGKGGTALQGKITFNAVSTGGPEGAYRQGGHNGLTIRQFLAPYEATARLCLMRYLPPFVTYAALRMKGDGEVDESVRDYQRVLEALVGGRLDLAGAAKRDRLNEDVDAVVLSTTTPVA